MLICISHYDMAELLPHSLLLFSLPTVLEKRCRFCSEYETKGEEKESICPESEARGRGRKKERKQNSGKAYASSFSHQETF